MSRRLKRLSTTKHCADVTLNHFADSSSASNRLKKGQLQISSKHAEELDWFDREESDYDEKPVEVPVFVQSNEGKKGQGDCPGRLYPLDLWFVLSDYIRPEAVANFAVLCRDAYFVTCTVSFHRRMWASYEPRPPRSAPTRTVCRNVSRSFAMRERKGFCADVIRALHFCYPVFTEAKPSSDVHSLVGWRCVMQWHQLFRRKCVFNFKMKSPPKEPSLRLRKIRDESSWWNPEEECSLLQIVCENFIDLSGSQIGGLTLTNCHVTVSPDMMRQKVKLVFHDTRRTMRPAPMKRYKEATGKVLVLYAVVHWQLLPWWRQGYNFHNIKEERR